MSTQEQTEVKTEASQVVTQTDEGYKSPEQIEFDKAQAEVAAAEEAAKKAAEAKPNTSEPEKQPEPAKPTHAPQLVPVGVALVERKKAQEAERRAAELEGENRVLRALAKVDEGKEPEKTAPTPQDKLAAIRKQRKELAAKFDSADLSMEQLREQDSALEDQEWEVRQQLLVASIPQPTRPEEVVQVVTEDQHAAALESKYPFLVTTPVEELARYARLVKALADVEGQPIKNVMDLRERVAKAIDAKRAQPSTPASSQAALSPIAQAREEKLTLADRLPPDIGKMGSPGTGVGPTESELLAQLDNAKNEKDQAAILKANPALIQKVMGRASL